MMDGSDYSRAARILPHNIDAEQVLLGSILVRNDVIDAVSPIVQPWQFSDPLHARVFEIACKLHEAGRAVTEHTLREYFEREPDLAPGVSWPIYLARLATTVSNLSHAKDYATTVRDLAIRRELVRIGDDVTAAALDTAAVIEPKEIVRSTEEALYSLAEQGHYGRGSQPLSHILADVMSVAYEAHKVRGRTSGLRTGFLDLDERLGGLSPGNLIILAGRPSMGKTALALNMAYRLACRGVRVQFDSMEMSSDELGMRLLAEASDTPATSITNGQLTNEQIEHVANVSRQINDLPLWIDDAGGLTIGKLAARARRVKRQRGIQCLFVDYLQLMAGGSNNRVADVTDITTGLKALAKDLGIPIIALSQLSRKCEERTDKRPQLADLRDSGSIEQDADIVLFVYRDEYYVEREKPAGGPTTEYRMKLADVAGKAEVIVAKQRHGPCGIVEMAFDAALTRFADLVKSPHPSMERHQ